MILVLAGSGEARVLCAALAAQGRRAIASLAGATRDPRPLPLPTRIGGFGGAEGFARYLETEGIAAVIDATHPFALRMPPRTAALCAARGLPHLRLMRPGWTAGPADRWTRVPDIAAAAAAIPAGARAFLATGRQSLPAFAAVRAETFLRVIDPPDRPYPLPGGWVPGRPPFTPEADAALFRALAITHLVTKDSGGEETRAKLDAAAALGLPVIMVDRPPPLPGQVADVQAALNWLEGACPRA